MGSSNTIEEQKGTNETKDIIEVQKETKDTIEVQKETKETIEETKDTIEVQKEETKDTIEVQKEETKDTIEVQKETEVIIEVQKEETKDTIEEPKDTIEVTKKILLLFGPFGSGKTSLLNYLCKTNFKGDDLSSETQYGDVGKNYGTWNNIDIYDTPGIFSSNPDTIKSQLYMLAGLFSTLPISKVAVCVPVTERLHDTTERTLSIIQDVFSDHCDNFMVIFTKCDTLWNGKNPSTFEEWYKRQKEDVKKPFNWYNTIIGLSSIHSTKSEQIDSLQKLNDSIVNTKKEITNKNLEAVKNVIHSGGTEKMLGDAINNLWSLSPMWRSLSLIPLAPMFMVMFNTVKEANLRRKWNDGDLTKEKLVELATLKK